MDLNCLYQRHQVSGDAACGVHRELTQLYAPRNSAAKNRRSIAGAA